MPLNLWLRAIIGGILAIVVALYIRQRWREEEEKGLWMSEMNLNSYLRDNLSQLNESEVSGLLKNFKQDNTLRHRLLEERPSRHFLILGLLLLLIFLLSWLL
jgi:hypothetical protein